MATISALRDGLRANLATIADFAHRAYDTWPAQLHAPCALVAPAEDIQYHQTMGSGVAVITFTVTVLAAAWGQSGQERAQDALDQFLNATDAKSVKRALEADSQLGGQAHDLIVTRCFDIGALVPAMGTGAYLGAKWEVRVTATL